MKIHPKLSLALTVVAVLLVLRLAETSPSTAPVETPPSLDSDASTDNPRFVDARHSLAPLHSRLAAGSSVQLTWSSDGDTKANNAPEDLTLQSLGPWDANDSPNNRAMIAKIRRAPIKDLERLTAHQASMDPSDPTDVMKEAKLTYELARSRAHVRVLDEQLYITVPKGEGRKVAAIFAGRGYHTTTKHAATIDGQRVDTVFPILMDETPDLTDAVQYRGFAERMIARSVAERFNQQSYEARQALADALKRQRTNVSNLPEADRELIRTWSEARIGEHSRFDRGLYLVVDRG